MDTSRDLEKVLYYEQDITLRIHELGNRLNRDFAGRKPIFVAILRGSFMFIADLVRTIDLDCRVDFMSVSSYGGGTATSGKIVIEKDIMMPITGEDVILIDDILDSGNTLYEISQILRARGPRSLKTVVLLDKPSRREKPIEADYVGFTIDDVFVVGYGLDYDQRYRNLRHIGVLKPSVYQK